MKMELEEKEKNKKRRPSNSSELLLSQKITNQSLRKGETERNTDNTN